MPEMNATSTRRNVKPTVRRSEVRPVTTARPAGRPSTATTRRGGQKNGSAAAPPPAPAMLTVSPGDLAADTMSVTNRVDATSRCIAMGEDGTIWTGEADGSIVIRVPPLGQQVAVIPGDRPRSGRPSPVTAMIRVEENMWAAYSNGTLKVFATEPDADGAIQTLSESHQLTATVHAMCAAGDHVYTAGGDWKVYMWDAHEFRYMRLFYGHKNNIRALAAYADPEEEEDAGGAAQRVVSAGDDGTVRIWDPAAPSQSESDVACLATIEMPGRTGVWSLAVVADTMELWVGCEDGVIRVYDLYSKTCMAEIAGHTAPVVALRQIDDNVWSGAKNGTLIIVARYAKEVVNVVKQPASGGGAAGGARFNLCIQPVQRTVVNNVWVTNTEGSWQCWSQLTPESVTKAAAGYKYAGAGAANAEEEEQQQQQRGGKGRGGVKTTDASNAPHVTAPAESPDERLRRSVANLRRTVDTMENEAEAQRRQQEEEEAAAAAAAAAAAGDDDDNDDDDDESARLDLIEESIRRDRDAALKAAAAQEKKGDEHDEY